MNTTIVGYPRIGRDRELKKAVEQYLRAPGPEAAKALQATAASLRLAHWKKQKDAGLASMPSNDFSFYDQMLDMAALLNVTPARYRALPLPELDRYFAMARGYQGPAGDVKALPMKKWFNTNYHYIVPEIGAEPICLAGSQPFDAYREAKASGYETRPVLIGPYTFLKLSTLLPGVSQARVVAELGAACADILARFDALGVEWVQWDEPALVRDMEPTDISLFTSLYDTLLARKGRVKVLLQTYFGDIRDVYRQVVRLRVDAIGLDFVEGGRNLELLRAQGFPSDKVLVAGVVNGRNIWRNHYAPTLELIAELRSLAPQLALSTSCSLLHVPYSAAQETELPADVLAHFAFAEEKLRELADLAYLSEQEKFACTLCYQQNERLFEGERIRPNAEVRAAVAALSEEAFTRRPAFAEREAIQRDSLSLPLLPTTTIGSFPQTPEVRRARAQARKSELSPEAYADFLREKTRECVLRQEEIGLDVLVHGEFERNDMVEYFGENLDGFLFTRKAWVQSYGTRCVKPPVIWGDVSWRGPITVETACYAQSLTKKPLKGMLTGPVTILNWSFPREDISLRDSALQIAFAIRREVLALEAAGIRIIQVDEAALKEKLPLRRSDWHSEYLDWAIPAFRLVHSGVKPSTQIHTHMCYSEFGDILADIDAMDADVITFEASRAGLGIVEGLRDVGFRTEIGPGVYDIHSPRIPSQAEIVDALERIIRATGEPRKLWVNPDCGLKTRGNAEVWPSLEHLVAAAAQVRSLLAQA